MQLGSLLNSKELKSYAVITLSYLLISLLMFWPMILNIANVVPGTGGDTFQSLWELWWVPYSLFTLHTTPYFTHYIFYPIGANLATQTLAPLAGIFSTFFQPGGLPFAFNVLFLLGFTLSGLFAYILAFHVTKQRWASFIAGVIYAFSPIHTIQAFGHLQFTNIEFIPLFLLFLLLMLEHKKLTYAVGAGVSFVLLTFMGDIEQGLMAMMIAFFTLLYFLVVKDHRHKVLNTEFALSFGVMLIVALALGAPFLFGILSALTPGTLATVNAQAGTAYNAYYSPDLLAFFIPSTLNGPLSFASNAFSLIYGTAPAERTAYIGYSVIALVIIAFFYEFGSMFKGTDTAPGKWADHIGDIPIVLALLAFFYTLKSRFKDTGVFLLLLVIFGLLTLGPYLQINSQLTGVPGLYLLYHQIPLFNVLREPGRFDIPLELFIAIFAAVGLFKLQERVPQNMKAIVPVVFLVLILLEYNSWPVSGKMLGSMYTFNTTIPTPYHVIGNLTANFSMLMLPALPNYTNTTPALYQGLELYYQSAYKKPLFGGYVTRSNATQTFLLVDMPLAVSAYYLQNGDGLVYGSPLQTNYSDSSAFLMGESNVGFVSVVRHAYNRSDLLQLSSYLYSFLGQPVYQDNSTIIFPTNKLISRVGSVRVAYTPVLFNNPESVWQPGWVLCGNSPLCSNDTRNSYFGANPAFIKVFSPNQANVNMSFSAMAPVGYPSGQAGVFLNNEFLATLNLTLTPKSFRIPVRLSPGLNDVIFVGQNATPGTYSNLGLNNFTFK